MIKITKEDRRLQHASADHTDGKRYALQGVHFNEKFAVATDGRGLAIKRKTSTIDNKNVKFPTPYSARDVEYDDDTVNTDRKIDRGEILDGRFPSYQNVIRDVLDKKTKFRIKLDAKILFKLARALADDWDKERSTYVEIDIPDDGEQGIFVIKGSGPGIGLLMPTFGGEEKPAPREILKRLTTEDPFLNFIDDELEGKHKTEEQ